MNSPAARMTLREAASALQRGDFAAAAAAASRVLAQAPEDADALNLLGLARFNGGDAKGGIAAAEAAVAARPGYRNAWDNLIGMLEAGGHARDAARAALRGLAARGGASVDELCEVAQRSFGAGLLDAAADCLQRALEAAPTQRTALRYLAVVRNAQRQATPARQLIARLVDSPPVSLIERATFAAIWSRATEPAELSRALGEALRVLEADPTHAGACDSAAIILGKLGRRAEARAMAQQGLQRAAGDADLLFTLVRLLEEDGLLDEAQEVLAQAKGAASSDARLVRSVGTVALRLAQPQRAAAAFSAALALAPDDQSAIAQRGLALDLAGETEAAREWLGEERFIRVVHPAVPSPFATAAQFNNQLAQDIRQHSRLRFEPIGLAAKGGYLTEDLLADRTPAITGFERSLRAAIDATIATLPHDPAHPFLRGIPRHGYTLNLWATRVAAQGVIDTHIHEESWLSGAYYVELPPTLGQGDGYAGWLEFGLPHRNLPAPPAHTLRRFQPEVGKLLVFPSYLYHRTLPFAGDGERISISFDLTPLHP